MRGSRPGGPGAGGAGAAAPGSLSRNFLMNAALTVSSFVFPLITFPYISRVLLPAGTGRVSFAAALISYFLLFSQLGIPAYGVRACARVRDDRMALTRTAHELLLLNLMMSVLAYAALAAALVLVPRLREDRALYLVMSSTILLSAMGMEWLYKALERYAYITLISLLFKLLSLAAMFLLVRGPGDYVAYGAVSVLGSSAYGALSFLRARRYIRFRPVGGYDLRRHLRPVGIFFAMSCATTVYTNMDAVMLGFISGDAEVGYYNVAVKVKNLLVSATTSLGTVLLPRSSYFVEQGRLAEFRGLTRKALRFELLLAAPLTLYFILYAAQGVRFLSGPEYAASVLPMRIVMPTVLLISITNVLGIQMLVPLGRERLVLWSELAGTAVNLLANALLIPVYRSAGAAVGTLAAEFTVLAVQYAALRRELSGALRRFAWWKPAVGLCAGAAASLWAVRLGWGDFPTLAVTACLFFGVYGLCLLLTREELAAELIGRLRDRIKAVL